MEIKKASLRLKNKILRDSELVAEAFITLACLEEGRIRRLPEPFKNLV